MPTRPQVGMMQHDPPPRMVWYGWQMLAVGFTPNISHQIWTWDDPNQIQDVNFWDLSKTVTHPSN